MTDGGAMELRFTIPGALVPWQRTASYAGRRLTPERQRHYQAGAKLAASFALFSVRGWPLDARYRLELHIHRDRKRYDLDNAAKTILDSMQGILWADDTQVDVLVAVRHHDGKDPRAEVYVRVLDALHAEAAA